jgi:predicted metal-dependent phosphoesterase TrpH
MSYFLRGFKNLNSSGFHSLKRTGHNSMHQEKLIDLHMHSHYSDGQLSPAELVDIAAGKSLKAIALADHDCLDGVGEYIEAANRAGIETISGVELSCIYKGRDLHILGYGVDENDKTFQDMLLKFRDTREHRGLKIIEKLGELGVHLDAAKVLEKAGDGALGRPHIAEALVEGGYVKVFGEAFDKYIGEDCPAYVDKYKMSPKEAVQHIHRAGGLAFVAHPGFYMEDLDAFYELLGYGFDGVEVNHSKHDEQTAQLSVIADERGLLKSGGSDFHGFARKESIGDPKVPYEYFSKIAERLDRRVA